MKTCQNLFFFFQGDETTLFRQDIGFYKYPKFENYIDYMQSKIKGIEVGEKPHLKPIFES